MNLDDLSKFSTAQISFMLSQLMVFWHFLCSVVLARSWVGIEDVTFPSCINCHYYGLDK